MPLANRELHWTFGNYEYRPGNRPLMMGIVNITPDSFSDGGQFFDPEQAVAQGLRLVDEGADILDIGGESTRPGAVPVPLDEELRRVIPVIRRLAAQTQVPISIDTYKPEVAQQALDSGARIVNDISGLRADTDMANVCAKSPCGVICMHMQGTPQTMQQNPTYTNVVDELMTFFEERLETLERVGIPRERVVLDPGIGFGKTAQHNLEILSSIERLHELNRPILIGHSRKRFLQKILGEKLDERAYGTVGVSIALAQQHVDILRVHDIAGNRDAITAWGAIATTP
ncbi:dihydropteroate synthase [Schlesneria paludicola]|uniref:dihydropteroate synthase n=1 Tax=Schlesneria paludicola TaxID=360056 RepID=UPI00029A802A|nr:dihydropteroate synthase [Schlesneria paludicola]